MKKKSYCLTLGIMALAAASCSQSDDPIAGQDGRQASVTVTVTADEAMSARKTRSEESYADPGPTQCYLEIWQLDEEGNRVAGTVRTEEAEFDAEGKCTFEVKDLEKANTYRFGFWASNAAESEYVGKESVSETSGWLSNITLNPAAGIAFSATYDYEPVDGGTLDVRLKHVVAKIELRHTGDEPMKDGDVLKLSSSNPAWTYNAMEGVYLDPDRDNPISWDDKFSVSSANTTGTLGATYIMTSIEDQELIELQLSLTRSGASFGTTPLNLSNVPVRANCRTIISGDFNKLYNGLSLTIQYSIYESWEDDNNQSIPE